MIPDTSEFARLLQPNMGTRLVNRKSQEVIYDSWHFKICRVLQPNKWWNIWKHNRVLFLAHSTHIHLLYISN